MYLLFYAAIANDEINQLFLSISPEIDTQQFLLIFGCFIGKLKLVL